MKLNESTFFVSDIFSSSACLDACLENETWALSLINLKLTQKILAGTLPMPLCKTLMILLFMTNWTHGVWFLLPGISQSKQTEQGACGLESQGELLSWSWTTTAGENLNLHDFEVQLTLSSVSHTYILLGRSTQAY